MNQQTALRTKKQLADHATTRGIPVSRWQVDEWIQDGFLPPAEPVPSGPKRQGRPHKLYGEQAFEAVCWLGEHRSRIDGADTTRFWMRLWDFDYVQVNLAAVVLAEIQRLWARMQEDIPSLPPIDQIDHLSDRQIDQLYDSEHGSVLDEFDAYARSLETGPLGGSGPGLAYLAGMIGGAIPADGLESYVDLNEVDGETTTRSLLDLVIVGEGNAEGLADAVKVNRMIDLYRVIKGGTFDLRLIRVVWHLLTPQVLMAIAGVPCTPLFKRALSSLSDHSTLMRALDYDPAAVAGMAFALSSGIPGGLAALAEALNTSEALNGDIQPSAEREADIAEQ